MKLVTTLAVVRASFWKAALSASIGLFLAYPAHAQIETATVTGGQIEGVAKDGIASFKGIPFAAPPVGDLRWKAPQPLKAWTGIRNATQYGPAPMQDPRIALLSTGGVGISEDCLYLNVWTPAKNRGEKLPVMVWIYGGGFAMGATSTPIYDGTHLAKKGAVLVSIAYRVGPFGFLAHPELTAEEGGSGCYGIEDQVAGLKWVHDNIAQFGGDPSRVTIFGESAGGISVCMLTVVPSARGLFQRAISESGGSMAPAKHDSEAAMMIPTLKLAEQAGKRFLKKLGVEDIKAARNLNAYTIQSAAGPMGTFWPVADGQTLPADAYALHESRQFNDTPILVGTNSDEGAMFVHGEQTPASFEKLVRSEFGPAADAMLKAYPHETDTEAFKSTKDLFREGTLAWPTFAWASLESRTGRNNAYVYYFDHHSANSDGANHAAELQLVFGNFLRLFGNPTAEDLKLSDLIDSYWINFAKTGDPNGVSLPDWPAFDSKKMYTMFFDDAPSARPLPNLPKLQAFDKYFAWRRKDASTPK